MIPVAASVRIWIATGHTDMRKGMNGLALLVQEGLGRDPFAGDVFVFRGRGGSLIKALWHDGIGTKWSTGEITRHPDYFQTLGIPPDQERSVGLISYGYPAKLPAQTRRPVCEVLHRLP